MTKIVKAVAAIGFVALGVFTGGVAFLPGTALAFTVGSSTFLAAGLALGASLLSPSPKAPRNNAENYERLRASLDPRTPRKTVVGVTAMATDIRDEEFTNNQEFYHRFIVVASHKVQSIDEIWFDDKVAWTAAGGAQGEFAGYLTVATRTEGNAGNAINISARMGSTRRYTGLAYVHLRYKLTGIDSKAESPFAQSITTRITIRGKGAILYDPREDSTVSGGSGTHRADDQATWTWDEDAARNPALQLLFYLLGYKINDKLAVGKGIPASRIDLASFAIAANICDELVAKEGGGTEPRYRSDGVWSEGDGPTTVIDMLKATMNADLDDVGGKLRLTIFTNDLATPVADFTDDDILDDFEWQKTAPLDQTFNVVSGIFTDPSNTSLYQQIDYPRQEVASPDGIERASTFNLPMVQSADQAQRLARLRLNRQIYGAGTFKANFKASGWKVQKNSIIRLTFAPTGFTNKLFRVADIEFRQDGVVPLTLREESALIYDSPTLAPAVAPIASTPYDPALSPIVQAIEQGLIIFSDPAPFNIQASQAGVTTTDLAAVSRSITLFIGGAAQTSGVTVGTLTTTPSAALTASASVSSGVVTVTLSKADLAGSVNVPVIFDGVTYNRTVIVNRATSTVAAGGGPGSSSYSDYEWANISTATLEPVTDVGAIVQSNASGELEFRFNAGYEGSAVTVARAQYSIDGTTWSDAGGGDVAGSVPIQTPGEEDPGYIGTSFTQTGLASNTDYYVRLRCRRSVGTGTISFLSPNFTVLQP